jgi:hypothetical protein
MVVYGERSEAPEPLPQKPGYNVPRYRGDDGTRLAHIPEAPSFYDATVNLLGDWEYMAPNGLTMTWSSAEGFLATRFGLADPFGERCDERSFLYKRIGLSPADPHNDVIRLYRCVAEHNRWPLTCDLSPLRPPTPGVFPSPDSANVLVIRKTDLGYVVAIQDEVARSWKLLISDPLTIVQIEREGWCSDGKKLISNLVMSGLPFEVLLKDCVREGRFHRHPGPMVHPDGRSPRLPDYHAYRHDLADFLSQYPHARAAALCAGGVLWRLAMDALQFTSESEVVGPFHASSCFSRVVGGETYWTPNLSTEEENVIVGVYRWAVSESNDKVVFTTTSR